MRLSAMGQANWLRIERLQRCNANGVDSAEDENHGQSGATRIAVLLVGRSDERTCYRHADPNKTAASHAEKHERSTTNTFDQRRAAKGKEELETCVRQVDVGLRKARSVTGGNKYGSDEVSERSIAGPLTEDRENAVTGNAIAAGSVAKQGAVVPPSSILYNSQNSRFGGIRRCWRARDGKDGNIQRRWCSRTLHIHSVEVSPTLTPHGRVHAIWQVSQRPSGADCARTTIEDSQE